MANRSDKKILNPTYVKLCLKPEVMGIRDDRIYLLH